MGRGGRSVRRQLSRMISRGRKKHWPAMTHVTLTILILQVYLPKERVRERGKESRICMSSREARVDMIPDEQQDRAVTRRAFCSTPSFSREHTPILAAVYATFYSHLGDVGEGEPLKENAELSTAGVSRRQQ